MWSFSKKPDLILRDNAALDKLLADHDTRADINRTIETVRALGLEPRPDVLRQQAVLNEVEADRAELIVALIGRRDVWTLAYQPAGSSARLIAPKPSHRLSGNI